MPNDKESEVRRLLEALPIQPDRKGRIRNATFGIMYATRLKGRYQRIAKDPHLQLVGKKIADARLSKVAKRVSALRGAVADLSNEGVLLRKDTDAMDEALEAFMDAVEHARHRLLDGEISPPRKGRHPKFHPLYVARSALEAFEDLTGKSVTIASRPSKSADAATPLSDASGAYFKLVNDLFNLHEIDAKAEHYAVQAMRRHRAEARRKQKKRA